MIQKANQLLQNTDIKQIKRFVIELLVKNYSQEAKDNQKDFPKTEEWKEDILSKDIEVSAIYNEEIKEECNHKELDSNKVIEANEEAEINNKGLLTNIPFDIPEEELVTNKKVEFNVDDELLQQKIELFCNLRDPKKWAKSMTTNGVDVFTFIGEGNQTGVMGTTKMPYNHEDIINALNDPKIPFKANPFGEKMEIVQRIDLNTVILYMKFKGMLIVSGRDFVIFSKKIQINDFDNLDTKVNAMIGFSVDHPNAPESPQNTVRAEMIVAGWILTEIDEENTFVTNFGVNDLKGSMPKFVINASASTHSGLLVNLKKQLDILKEKGMLYSQQKL